MNYRHAFHAGNFADVVKHTILTRIIAYLQRKDAPFRVIDTHAGVGLYDLSGNEAERTGEWQEGIGLVMERGLPKAVGDLMSPYLAAVRAQNADGRLRFYPGSPMITRHMLRPQDRMMALELHPGDAWALKKNFADDIQVRVTNLDGWAAMGTHLPPKERRGLVLVDPPFEEKGEFQRMGEALVKSHARWPGGIYAFWYPIKEPGEVEAYVRGLKATGIRKILRLELAIGQPSVPARLHGTGMIVVNPPYTLEKEMAVVLPALARLLGGEGGGRHRIEWVTGE
jgi:23S rRNA (adenine2030-N6)-methyltransferase